MPVDQAGRVCPEYKDLGSLVLGRCAGQRQGQGGISKAVSSEDVESLGRVLIWDCDLPRSLSLECPQEVTEHCGSVSRAGESDWEEPGETKYILYVSYRFNNCALGTVLSAKPCICAYCFPHLA